jgi:ABC-type sugar transport system permease subunit
MSKSPKTAKASYSVLQQKKDLIFVLCMLAVPVVNFLLFWLWPNFRSITMAFEIPSVEGFTFYNFERFFNELASPVTGPGLWKQIGNSFLIFFVGTFVNLPMVLFMSYVMFKKVRGYKIFRVLFYLPSIIGGTVMSQIFRSMVAVRGPIHSILVASGVEFNQYAGLLGAKETGMLMMIIYTLWTGVGSNMIMFTGAMNRVPQDIFESARIDGIGFFREFFNIILPLIWPTVNTMVVFSMVGVFSNAGIVMLLCPDNAACHNIGYYILRFTLNANNTVRVDDTFSYPAAVGLLFTLVNIPLVFGVKALCDRVSKNVEY